MKLLDIINNVIKTKENSNINHYTSLYEEILDAGYPAVKDGAEKEIDSSIKEYWVQLWYCTDTYVGNSVLFFKEKPVCYITQSARRNDRKYHWISKEVFNEVANYLRSFIVIEENENVKILSDEDMNCNIGEYYEVQFSQQLLDKEVYYKGKLHKVASRHPDQIGADGNFTWSLPQTQNILIENESGEKIKVGIKEVKVRYHVSKDTKHETPAPKYKIGETVIYTLPQSGFGNREPIPPFDAKILDINNELGYNVYKIEFYIDNQHLPESARTQTLDAIEESMQSK